MNTIEKEIKDGKIIYAAREYKINIFSTNKTELINALKKINKIIKETK